MRINNIIVEYYEVLTSLRRRLMPKHELNGKKLIEIIVKLTLILSILNLNEGEFDRSSSI